MGLTELFIIAIGLSMDAFAVSICKGLSVQKVRPVHLIKSGLWFGGFQALMPLAGYFLGVSFADFVGSVDHWVAFILLGIIGGNMIKESSGKEYNGQIQKVNCHCGTDRTAGVDGGSGVFRSDK